MLVDPFCQQGLPVVEKTPVQSTEENTWLLSGVRIWVGDLGLFLLLGGAS